MKRSLTGITPSGDAHIGNYLGMMKPALARQAEFQCVYFISDLHALTSVKDAERLKSLTLDLVATWVALEFDIDKHVMFKQSDIPEVCEFSWYLSCVTGMGFLEKAHAYKDNQQRQKEVNHGLFYYPVLMASDILMYDVDIVPVGKDQKQHVEMARDMAGSFNAAFGGDFIKLPEVKLEENTMIIPGLDGQKMSKRYGNTIPLFDSEKQTRKKIMSIATDSTALEEPKSMKGSALGDLFALFASNEQWNDLETRLQAGGTGWGHAKDELATLVNEELSGFRGRYKELRADEAQLYEILNKGAEKAREISMPVLERVRKAVGVL